MDRIVIRPQVDRLKIKVKKEDKNKRVEIKDNLTEIMVEQIVEVIDGGFF